LQAGEQHQGGEMDVRFHWEKRNVQAFYDPIMSPGKLPFASN